MGGEGYLLARGASERDVEGIGAHDLELEAVDVGAQIERAAVGVAHVLGFDEDSFHEAGMVALRRQRNADLDQLGEAPVRPVLAAMFLKPPRLMMLKHDSLAAA